MIVGLLILAYFLAFCLYVLHDVDSLIEEVQLEDLWTDEPVELAVSPSRSAEF